MTILIGYTPSPASRAALDAAMNMARTSGDRLVVMNAGPGGENRTDSSMTTQQKQDLQQELAESGLKAEFREYARGKSTVEEFQEVVADLKPKVLVIGMRPRSGFRRFVMGSVGDELLRTLDTPILVVKASYVHDPNQPDADHEKKTFEG